MWRRTKAAGGSVRGFALTVVLAVAFLTVTIGVAEVFRWRASRRRIGTGAEVATGPEAIVVLGYRTPRSGQLHPLQRWRVEIAVRSMDPGRATTLVFTGAGRPGGPSDAEVMAAYARDRLGVPDDRIVLETEARSTAQNLEYTAPIIATATRITIASDPDARRAPDASCGSSGPTWRCFSHPPRTTAARPSAAQDRDHRL